MNVILEKFPYRYIEMDNLLENGHPDYRIQKFHDWTQRYRDMYLNCLNLHRKKERMQNISKQTY